MEEYLDKIASSEAGRVDWLRDLSYGHDGEPGLNEPARDLGVTHDQSRNVSAHLAIPWGVVLHA